MQTDTSYAKQESPKVVYVRPVASTELPDAVREQIGEIEIVYSVHDEEGEQLAIVANRRLAFHLARENDLSPVSVH